MDKEFNHIYFGDETFGFEPKQFKRMCELLKQDEELKNATWSCETRADVITEEWAKTASQAGCALVKLGIESGDEYIRNQVYKKNISEDDINTAAKFLRKYKIEFVFLILLGSHKESEASIEENLRFLKAVTPTFFYFCLYSPTPGTELYETTKKALEEAGITRKWDKNAIPMPIPPAGLDLKLGKFRFLKLKLFIKNGIRLGGVCFILDLIPIAISSLLSLNKKDFNIKLMSVQKIFNKYLIR